MDNTTQADLIAEFQISILINIPNQKTKNSTHPLQKAYFQNKTIILLKIH
jgi:hypothetical protein